MKKLVLIDGNSLINRAFYAMPILTTKNGEFTNAVYGFMNMFTKMVQEEKPTYVAVAFDLKAPTFRHKIYDQYKGTRKPMPEELRPQIDTLKNLLKLMGVCVLEKAGSEADDIIGTIAKATDVKTIIITGDKDSFQLVDEQTEVHFTKRGLSDVDVYNYSNFQEKTGIEPWQIIELKALMGDTSDNIPGIPGVGEKTALNLVQTYSSVENLYEHVDELKGKLQEKVILGKESAFLSKTLATIDLKVDVTTDLNDMTFPFPFSSQVRKRFTELEFKSLISRNNLFDLSSDSENEMPKQEIDKPTNVEKIKVEDLSILDLNTIKGEIAFCITEDGVYLYNDQKEYALQVKRTLLDDGFNLGEIITYLKPIFQSQNTLITFSKKQLNHLLFSTLGITLDCKVEDLSLIKYLADFGGKEETLSQVLIQYDGDEKSPALSLYKVYLMLKTKLAQEKMQDLYYDVELPLADVLFDMEVNGFKIDAEALSIAGEKFKNEITLLENQIKDIADEPNLNVNSPRQLGEVLFEKLKVGKGKKTKTGYSTSAEVLENLDTDNPIVPLILQYRKLQKIYSTYIEGFKPLIDKTTGLIHTSFNQTVTATGRLSSSEPNLQNIPVREDLGKELRKFFVSRHPDGVLIGADYSQIELRLLAEFSKANGLVKAYQEGQDIHTATASKVFGVSLEQVTSQMRSSAKAVNFGIIYGMSEYGLAKNIKVSPAEARRYISAYFSEYPEVKEYMNKNVDFARENGYSTTILGRRRYIAEINSANHMIRSFGERVAMNMPLQGSSADIIKLAMLGVSNRLKKEGLTSKLILTVHDELIVDATKDEADLVEKILTEEMENAVELSVPLTVSVGKGKTWFDAK